MCRILILQPGQMSVMHQYFGYSCASGQPVLKPVRECEPSQNGLLADCPQRHNDPRILMHSWPNWLCSLMRPRKVIGPSLMQEIVILLGRFEAANSETS